MIWPFENDTSAIEKKIAGKSFRADKSRNIIAVIAIVLTSILFTSLFTLGTGMTESMHRADMILSGGDGHARIQEMSDEEFEAISSHPLVREIAYCRKLADSVDNQSLSKREMEFWYYDDTGLKYNFIELSEGHKPEAENEIITDTETLELLGTPKEIGAEITLELTIHGKKTTRDFVLAGWWESYPGLQYGTIIASQAYVEAHADELKDTFREDHVDTGTVTGIVKFENAQDIEEVLKTVIVDSGYSMDAGSQNYINAGVNPMYLSQTTSSGTRLALICALLLFLFTGYLIIYNVFQISVLRDLHFYGLIKTIGTTERQINSIIRRQAWRLSAIGIPIGLCAGFFIGKAFLPLLLASTSFSADFAVVSPNPFIFAGAAVFAFITVRISIRKPAKMAAKVSPIEAVRYTDSDTVHQKEQKKNFRSGALWKGMARANLRRNKKRTVLVVLSLSLSIVFANTVFTFSNSVDPERAIKNMISSDFCIGQSSLLDNFEIDEESALSESFIREVEERDGFEEGAREYGCAAAYRSGTTRQIVNQQENGAFSTHIYGLEPLLLSELELIDGELDADKLASGNYILEGAYVNSRGEMDEDSLNHSDGDKVELDYNGSVREFTVLGHVAANEANTYDWVGSCFFLLDDVYKEFTGNTSTMSYDFNVSEDKISEMEAFLKQYTDEVEPEMTYRSKGTIMAGASDIQNIVVSVGGTMAFIIGMIGVLNFINTILTSIFTRKKEFAILQSIGMTGRQLMQMLCLEGCHYMILSVMLSVPLCLVSALMLVRPICNKIWFLEFRMNFRPLCILLMVLFLTGILIPYITYRMIDRQNVIERLKCGE